MLNALRRLFSPRDEETAITDRMVEQPGKILDGPSAGAGVIIAGTHAKSETEKELEQTANSQR